MGAERKKRAVRLAGFATFHMIAGRHHQVRRPQHLLAQGIKDWSSCFGDPIVPIQFARHSSKRTQPIAAINEALRNIPGPLKRRQDA
jgi:hypothetical protein